MTALNGIAIELDVAIFVTPNGIDTILDGVKFRVSAGASDFELKVTRHD